MPLYRLGQKRGRHLISNMDNRRIKETHGRRVRFSESSNTDITFSVGRSSIMEYKHQLDEEDDNNRIWYSKRELAVFTKQARDHVLGFRHESIEESTRGYERYGFARSKQKAMTRKIILLLMKQKALNDEEKSLIAHRSSSWAVEDAFVTGCIDFCEAYHPQMSQHFIQHQHQNQTGDDTNTQLRVPLMAEDFETFLNLHEQQNKKRKRNDFNDSCKCKGVRARAA